MKFFLARCQEHLKKVRWIIVVPFLVFIALVLWSYFSHIETISRATGQIIASARTQTIQTPNEGIIESIFVREGQKVTKGQLLVRLDKSQAQAVYQESLAKTAALNATLARLRAEVFEKPLKFPPELSAYPAFVENQRELFLRRQRALKSEIAALAASLRLVREELKLSLPLLDTGDIGKAEIIRLQRQVAEVEGQITNRRNRYFQDAQAEMTKAEEDLATQQQMLAERTTNLDRTEIKAQIDGVVRKILVTTLGAKVRPGDVVMEVLPIGGQLIMEAKLKPADIAFIHKGLPAAIKLDAYDYGVYGVLRGEVSYVSPDALTDELRTGEQIYYRVHVNIDDAFLAKHNQSHPKRKIEVQAGMTGTVEIRTNSQSVFSYLTKPVSKTWTDALSER